MSLLVGTYSTWIGATGSATVKQYKLLYLAASLLCIIIRRLCNFVSTLIPLCLWNLLKTLSPPCLRLALFCLLSMSNAFALGLLTWLFIEDLFSRNYTFSDKVNGAALKMSPTRLEEVSCLLITESVISGFQILIIA